MKFSRSIVSAVAVLAAASAVAVLAQTVSSTNTKPRVGPVANGVTRVATAQLLRPAGESVEFGGRPVDMALAPDGKTLYLKDNRGLVAVDAATWKLKQQLAFPDGNGGSLHGIAVSGDGTRVYATTAGKTLCQATVAPDGALSWTRQIALPGPDGKGNSYPCGLALSPGETRALVCLSRNNTLALVDLQSGELETQTAVGVAPFDVALSPDGATAYVSNWGGRPPRDGEQSAPSAGTPTLVDERGIANSGTVFFVDLATHKTTAQIAVGLHASDLELSRDGHMLCVANANSDTVSIIDTRAARARETILMRPDAALPFGSAPNALALGSDDKTLFVALGGNNAVAVVALNSVSNDKGKSRVRGFIPSGWYPGAVAARAGQIYIANVKGLGSLGPAKEGNAHSVKDFLGTVNRVAFPDVAALRNYSAQVVAGGQVPQILRAQEKARSGRKPVPVPVNVGEPSVIEHVVYIIKENRTYDQVFGDLKQADGDPNLCIFGREVTPNHHALAEQFALLDNYYCNGVISADGHSWATEGNVTDHLEKAFGGFTRSYTFGDDPLTYSSSGFLWDRVLERGLSFRNYGEMDYASTIPANATFSDVYRDFKDQTHKISIAHNIGIDRLRRYSNPDYPGWNLRIPDVLRADIFLKELAGFERRGTFPNLTIIYLPNDHTSGNGPGAPTPRAQVADNDLALGRIVEGISHSQFWPKTAIFVNEDDPQDGFDHVDGHRSLCLVVSPYTKRGAVISNFYNQTGVLHTALQMLGAPPLNQMDAASPLMRECFTDMPDLRPYTARPNNIPLDELNPPVTALRGEARHWAQVSARIDFAHVDAAPEDTLNRILWYSSKGNAPYPAQQAGAHGRGLKARSLTLSSQTKDDDD